MNRYRPLCASLLLVHLVSTAASAPNTTHICTTTQRSEWMPADEMQLLATHRTNTRLKLQNIAR